MKKYVCTLAILMLAFPVGCGSGKPTSGAEGFKGEPAEIASKRDEPSPYKQTTDIFLEFQKIAEKNADNPDVGLKECQKYVQQSIPALKDLTQKIKGIERGEGAVRNLPEIMESNNKIRSVSDKITQLAQEKYGKSGVDLLMSLSDLAMARL